ncbi:MAG: PHP domain-containing protein [Lachnospiraceae bacterium]|nr:PHP domain-containing protein [Lachnospiraceae bacterium]
MKLDMHCHTKEGSPDSSVPIEDYIKKLKSLGFGGMLVTDHDSYYGYRKYKYELRGRKYQDFVVLKGVEYDTLDAGHILVIMPETLKLRILELRGLPVSLLIDIVHRYGGVLGPAHPCGAKYMSYANTRRVHRASTMKRFDFVEVFNACENEDSNEEAQCIAEIYHKPGTAGSDAHKLDCVGLAWTEVPDDVRTESDLIRYIKAGTDFEYGGSRYGKTTKDKIGPFNQILVQLFFFYNRLGGLVKRRKRKKELKKPQMDIPADSN